MIELNTKLSQLNDSERIALYRELLEQIGEPSRRSVRELVLVYEDSDAADPDAIKEFARKHLPEHERPTRVVPTTKLPRTPHGKLDRRALPALIRNDQPVREAAESSAGFSDRNLGSVIETFKQVLGTSSIEPESNFFELGGHSLLAVECILALEERTGKRISITQFLNHPTVRGIAEQISEQSRQTYNYVYPVSEDLSGLPVFVFSASRLAYALRKHRPDWTIYGIQLRWRDENNEEIQYRDLEDMASHIAEEIKTTCDSGEFVLAGSSFPGMIAHEVARQLRASGAESALTILIEPSLFSSLRSWIEGDLDSHGKLREGKNHYVAWLRFNHPFRSFFWRRVYRRLLRRLTSWRNRNHQVDMQAHFKDYETARAIELWRGYRPARYDGCSLMLAGTKSAWRFQQVWVNLLGNKCSVHYLDTDHIEILKDPFMSDIVVPLLTLEVDSLLREEVDSTGFDANFD